MGLDISTKLIVGVPLDKLGTIEKTETEVKMYDGLGNPVGKDILEEHHLVCPNGKKFLLGSNKENLQRAHLTKYASWKLYDNDQCVLPMGQIGDYNNPYSIVVGQEIESCEKYTPDRYESWRTHELAVEDYEFYIETAATLLESEYGYTGQIYIICLSRHGY